MNVNTGLALTCEEVLDSLGAYALGALDDGEVDAIDSHLVDCTSCRAALGEHEAVAASLATMVRGVDPSPAVRERLLAATETPRPHQIHVVPPALEPPQRPVGAVSRWLLPAMSVAATLLLVGAGVLGVLLLRTIDQRDAALRSTAMLSTYASAGGEIVTLASQPVSEYEGYPWQGSLLTAPGKTPLVVVAGCPKSTKYFSYWVWFSLEGERTPAGKLTVRSDGSGWLYLKPDFNPDEFDMIGITVVLGDDEKQDVLVAPLNESI